MKQIDDLNARLMKARELLLTDAIDARDYKDIKTKYEHKNYIDWGEIANTNCEQRKFWSAYWTRL